MGRLPVTESSRGDKHPTPSASETGEINRLMSWDGVVQKLTESGSVIPRPKSQVTFRPLSLVSEITKLFLASIAKFPYTLFKFSYEMAKLFTRLLSRIRCLLSALKDASKEASQCAGKM